MAVFLKKKLIFDKGIYKNIITDRKTKKVNDFYKFTPFPNYKKKYNKQTILEKGDKNFLASKFKNFIGYQKQVLEVVWYRAIVNLFFNWSNNNIVALDPTFESINLAKKFADQNKIYNINFVNTDIFDDVLKENFFDFIWCNGVLHHTKDPYGAFKIIANSLKDEGYILIGLYNKIGRVRTIFRRLIYKLFGSKPLKILDPTLRNLKIDESEISAWIKDQYEHPIESLHTIDEVLTWFSKNNISFISSIPSADFDYDYNDIFKKILGNFFTRLYNQILMIFNNLGSDGGLFVVIGKNWKFYKKQLKFFIFHFFFQYFIF